MQTRHQLWAGFLALLIATGTYFYIDGSGIADDVRQYCFGDSTRFGTLSLYAGGTYWQRIKGVMMALFLFFAAYGFFFLLFFQAVALVYFLLSSKWRKPRVFISYKNTERGSGGNTTKIARKIKTQLEQQGFRTLFFEYNKTLHHDEVNFRIQENLRRCQAMVVIPDPQHPSYVNTEIQGAVLSYKPVYLIRHQEDQQLPDTANSGHSVLIWDKLLECKFVPLSYLLRYVHNYWTTRFFILYTPLLSFLIPFNFIDEEDNMLLKVLIFFALSVAILIYIDASVTAFLFWIQLTATMVAVYAAYATIISALQRSYLQKIARQSLLNGGSAYTAFEKAGIGKDILECMDKDGLKVKHSSADQ